MSSEAGPVAIAAVLDAVSLLRGEVAALARSDARIEETQSDIQRRLDVIEAGQAPLGDLVPFQEAILANTLEGDRTTHEWLRTIVPILETIVEKAEADSKALGALHEDVLDRSEGAGTDQNTGTEIVRGLEVLAARLEEFVADDRKQRAAAFSATASLIGYTRSAVLGVPAPLPADLEDDPILEQYLLQQPADLTSNDRALVDWRAAAAAASTPDLITLLRNQQAPSPTDTRQTRVMRYRLAAITRAQITGRGASLPPLPATTRASDRTAAAGMIRSHELADLWRSGNDTAILAEPELASVFDVFASAQRNVAAKSGEPPSPELVALYGELADRIELGERPTLKNTSLPQMREQTAAIVISRDR